jgi:hypothetical protein
MPVGTGEYSQAQKCVFKLIINTYCCARLYSSVPMVITHNGMDLVKRNVCVYRQGSENKYEQLLTNTTGWRHQNNSDNFSNQHWPLGFWDGDAICLPWGRKLIFTLWLRNRSGLKVPLGGGFITVSSSTHLEQPWGPTQASQQRALVALYPGAERTEVEGNLSPQS